MKDFFGFIFVAIMAMFGLWIAQQETPRQEMLIAIALIVTSVIVIVVSLKMLASESK